MQLDHLWGAQWPENKLKRDLIIIAITVNMALISFVVHEHGPLLVLIRFLLTPVWALYYSDCFSTVRIIECEQLILGF